MIRVLCSSLFIVGEAELFVTSDDGTAEIDGKPCKKLKDLKQKYFRALSITLAKAPL